LSDAEPQAAARSQERTPVDVRVETIQQQLATQGFCVVPDLIDKQTIDQARQVLNRLLAEEAKTDTSATGSQRVGRLVNKHPVFIELLCNQFVVDVWQQLLGADIICSSWSANTVFPGHESIGWHVDYPYWSKQAPWPEGLMAGQTVWMLDDFTDENGATGVVPGSHKKAHPPEQPTDQWRDDGKVLTGTAGSVVFADGAWWHTARPNRSKNPRSCLLGMYIMPWFLPQEDMGAQLSDVEDPPELLQQLLGAQQHRPRTVGA